MMACPCTVQVALGQRAGSGLCAGEALKVLAPASAVGVRQAIAQDSHW
jgi:hypothetical protein